MLITSKTFNSPTCHFLLWNIQVVAVGFRSERADEFTPTSRYIHRSENQRFMNRNSKGKYIYIYIYTHKTHVSTKINPKLSENIWHPFKLLPIGKSLKIYNVFFVSEKSVFLEKHVKT